MNILEVPKYSRIYGRVINGSPEFESPSIKESISLYGNGWRIVKNTNQSFLAGKAKFGVHGYKTNVLKKCPFLFVRNSIIVNDYLPDKNDWIALLSIRRKYKNMKKIHLLISVNHDINEIIESSISLAEAYKALEKSDIMNNVKYPIVITNSRTMYVKSITILGEFLSVNGTFSISKLKMFKLVGSGKYPIEFNISDSDNRKRRISITPNKCLKIDGVIDETVYELKYKVEEKKK